MEGFATQKSENLAVHREAPRFSDSQPTQLHHVECHLIAAFALCSPALSAAAVVNSTEGPRVRAIAFEGPASVDRDRLRAVVQDLFDAPATRQHNRPAPANGLRAHPVDNRVGNWRNDDAGLIAPTGPDWRLQVV